MTATDVLRRMLDERGVEYEGGERSLRWRDRHGIMMQAFPLANGELGMGVWSCTPEQAIAATLGATDAKPTQVESSGTCHDMYTDDDEWFACSECNTELRVHEPFGVIGSIRFCPNCGAKVVGPYDK